MLDEAIAWYAVNASGKRSSRRSRSAWARRAATVEAEVCARAAAGHATRHSAATAAEMAALEGRTRAGSRRTRGSV